VGGCTYHGLSPVLRLRGGAYVVAQSNKIKRREKVEILENEIRREEEKKT
jgi:transcriptional antiterminator Rof (Rho-off)